MVDPNLLLSLARDMQPPTPLPPRVDLDEPAHDINLYQPSSTGLMASSLDLISSSSMSSMNKKRTREEDEEEGEYESREKRPRLNVIEPLQTPGVHEPISALHPIHPPTGDLSTQPSLSTPTTTVTFPSASNVPTESATLEATPVTGICEVIDAQRADLKTDSPSARLGFQLPPKPNKDRRSRTRSKENDSLHISSSSVDPTSKLRMDQISASRVAKSSGTPPSINKWDHSKFYDPASNLAYLAFKDIRPTVPPQPRLPPAPQRDGFPVLGVHTTPQATFITRRNAPKAPRSHTAPQTISLPFKPNLATTWRARSLQTRPQVQSISTSVQKQHNRLTSTTSTNTPPISNAPSLPVPKAGSSDSVRVTELERQVQSLTDKLSNCQTELQETKVKLDFANMTAGRSGANLGNARKDIKELKERIKMLESVNPTVVKDKIENVVECPAGQDD
ncbi:hypothetical protein I302_103420 [Kwoniella bestiolae CBS 10118]|uniref:Uncharacterized protein n=1 Tax=Kwoniella bestiolae CBS 10118 TaxID=1296100 RepID=A0A1B9G8C9_9TREE|nr:hypothetical protein I302_02120 [Kwoniella bestiolae CBS 10118]OCF27279.1 hypothetical protein I302_02120 [Kwoniella bestiolae CBS 10118]